jgi:hypothetical protein
MTLTSVCGWQQELPVPILAWCFPPLLLVVMYLNIREAELYRQSRRLLLGACKALGVVMLLASSATFGCCPSPQILQTRYSQFMLEGVGRASLFFTMQLPGRVAMLLFAGLACQVSLSRSHPGSKMQTLFAPCMTCRDMPCRIIV